MTDGKYKQRSETGHCKPIFGAPIGLYFGDAIKLTHLNAGASGDPWNVQTVGMMLLTTASDVDSAMQRFLQDSTCWRSPA
jgi:hypothetical protein